MSKIARWVSVALALGLLLGTLPACSRVGDGVVKADVVKSDKARLTAPVNPAVLQELVAGNTQFALDLYRVVGDKGSNVFYSPYSISLALAMTYAGAKGQTAQEMAQALRYTLGQEQSHSAFNALDQALASRGEKTQERGEPFRLHIANALWGQKDFTFQPAFLDLLAQNYGAGLRILDFKGTPEPARQTINRWVEEQTEQKIKDLLPAGSINSMTRLVLSNAIYFKAGWLHPFDEKGMQDGSFQLLDGSNVTVPMMYESASLGYGEGDGYQIVELPYMGGEMSMVVLLPAAGRFEAFGQGLTAEQLTAMLDGIERSEIRLTLPKFRFEMGMSLKDALQRLGMVQAFDAGKADLAGMTGRSDLYISDVYHKAFVGVDEKGTEAAAATAVVMGVKGAPMQPKEVLVDRPFIFLIRDVQTGAILFLGHVVNPAK